METTRRGPHSFSDVMLFFVLFKFRCSWQTASRELRKEDRAKQPVSISGDIQEPWNPSWQVVFDRKSARMNRIGPLQGAVLIASYSWTVKTAGHWRSFATRGCLSSPCHIHTASLARGRAHKEKARDPIQEQQTERN